MAAPHQRENDRDSFRRLCRNQKMVDSLHPRECGFILPARTADTDAHSRRKLLAWLFSAFASRTALANLLILRQLYSGQPRGEILKMHSKSLGMDA